MAWHNFKVTNGAPDSPPNEAVNQTRIARGTAKQVSAETRAKIATQEYAGYQRRNAEIMKRMEEAEIERQLNRGRKKTRRMYRPDELL